MTLADKFLYQAATDFLRKHAKANDILMNKETGLPVKAVYSNRPEPAVFYFLSYEAK